MSQAMTLDVTLRVGDREYPLRFTGLPVGGSETLVAAAQRIIYLSSELSIVVANLRNAAEQPDPTPLLDRLTFERDTLAGEIRQSLATLERVLSQSKP
jgi:hypothetical protein